MRAKVKGSISVSIYFDCPSCKDWAIDLFDVDYLNDESQLWSVIQSNEWKNLDMEFECPKCKAQLIFDEMVY